MAPQPLSRLRNDAKPVFTGYAAALRPFHAMRVGKALAYSAAIESEIVEVLAEMLGEHGEAASAIYMALRSANAQTAAIQAVATTALDVENATRLMIIQDVASVANKHRNRFAHWLWGYADELPDHLLFFDPSHHRPRAINRAHVLNRCVASGDFSGLDSAIGYDPKYVLAYSLSDLDEAVGSLFRASSLFSLFANSISKHDPLQHQLSELLGSQREVAEGIARRQKNRATPP
jgi:hypothetical protein